MGENNEPLPKAAMLCAVCEDIVGAIKSNLPGHGSNRFDLKPSYEPEKPFRCALCAFSVSLFQQQQDPADSTPVWEYGMKVEKRTYGLLISGGPSYLVSNSSINLGCFSILHSGQDVSKEYNRRPIKSTIDIKMIKGWIHQCKTSHHHPQQPSTTSKVQLQRIIEGGNLQLIDVNTLEIHTILPGETPCYAALSYVWGSHERSPMDITQNSASCRPPHRTKLSLGSLRRTLREAIVLTRELHVPYMWIDELCIDQESPEAKEKIIPSMGSVYATSELVVVAAAGEGAGGGLPGTENHPRPQEKILLRFSTAAGDEINLVTFEPPREKIRNSRWFTRAWTFPGICLCAASAFRDVGRGVPLLRRGHTREDVHRLGNAARRTWAPRRGSSAARG